MGSGIAGQLNKAWIPAKFRQVGVAAKFLQKFGRRIGQYIQGAIGQTQRVKGEHGAADDLAVAGRDLQRLSDLILCTLLVAETGSEVADEGTYISVPRILFQFVECQVHAAVIGGIRVGGAAQTARRIAG